MTHHIMNCSTWCVVLLTLYSLILCVMTHTVVLVIQNGETALDRAREEKSYVDDEDEESRYDEVIKYLEEFGK